MPILGTIASSIQKSFGAFEPIATVTGTGSSGSISITGIPNTYQHLQVRMIVKDTQSATVGSYFVNFNGDTFFGNTNYAIHTLYGDGTSAGATGNSSTSYALQLPLIKSQSSYADRMGVAIIDLHDYASTTKNKTARAYGARDTNDSNGYLVLQSGLRNSTAAISSIHFFCGDPFTTSTTISLYGIKGA